MPLHSFDINNDIIKKYRRMMNTDITIKLWQLFCLSRRKYKIRQYFKSHEIRKLQLGSGENIIDGWLNTDVLPLDTRIIFLDITHQFPFEGNTFDYIFSEHSVEHISYEKACQVFQECYRVLKPGGIVRIATPDLRFLIDLFRGEKTDIQENYIKWAINMYIPQINAHNGNMHNEAFVVNNFFRNWGHQFIYDFGVLKKTLENVGFTNIVRCPVGKSKREILRGLEHHHTMIPSQFNDLETMAVEGEKI